MRFMKSTFAAPRSGAFLGVVSCLVGVAIVASLSGCDTTAKFRVSTVKVFTPEPLQIVTATPYQTGSDGARVPACTQDEAPEGFFLRFNLISTEHKGDLKGNKDLQIRDGDRIDKVSNAVTVGPNGKISPDIFGLQVDCAEAYPDDTEDCESDDGQAEPNSPIQGVEFLERTESRKDPIAVAILVDHSASMLGFGDQLRREVQASGLPGNRSDPSFARFHAAIEGVIRKLNEDDRLIGFYFNETGVNLACEAPGLEAIGDPVEREKTCFRGPHDWVGEVESEDGTSFASLALPSTIKAEGRTPLWAAVDHAWDFLQANWRDEDGNLKPAQIVVITDSPDTCSPQSVHFLPDEGCSQVSYEDVLNKVFEVGEEQRVPINMIQFQSPGYPAQDPAQMEISCATGGTYKWLNRLDYSDESSDFQDQLTEVLTKVRYTFGGFWRLHVELPSLTQTKGTGDPLLPLGRVFALAGALTLKSSIITPVERFWTFRLSEPNDDRLLVRKTCTADDQCPQGDVGACNIACIPQGNACAWEDQEDIPIGEGGECTTDTGVAGTCCCGACQATTPPAGEDPATCVVYEAPCCDPTQDDPFCQQ